ncbi:MAG: hypothetical protein KAI24_06860 [Planctomycetes bacterium]|nr:hypothetical protein [Planctomycetota bacterium]
MNRQQQGQDRSPRASLGKELVVFLIVLFWAVVVPVLGAFCLIWREMLAAASC